jgi:hypothetical protein
VHQIVVCEMVARAAKHAYRCRLLTEKSPPFDGGLCGSDDEDEVEVSMSPVDIAVATTLLNEILFDQTCPLEVLEADMTRIADLCDTVENNVKSGGGGFTSAIEEAQRLIDNVKSRGRLVIGGHVEGGKSGDWDPVLKANIDSELWQRRRKAQIVARRLGRKNDFWWKVESRAYLQLGERIHLSCYCYTCCVIIIIIILIIIITIITINFVIHFRPLWNCWQSEP